MLLVDYFEIKSSEEYYEVPSHFSITYTLQLEILSSTTTVDENVVDEIPKVPRYTLVPVV